MFFKTRYAYRSPEWKNVRKLHLDREPTCQACGRKKDLEVHHIVPVHIDKVLELEPSNLITLCEKCHLIFGHLYDFKSWNDNVIEDSNLFFKKVKHRPYNHE